MTAGMRRNSRGSRAQNRRGWSSLALAMILREWRLARTRTHVEWFMCRILSWGLAPSTSFSLVALVEKNCPLGSPVNLGRIMIRSSHEKCRKHRMDLFCRPLARRETMQPACIHPPSPLIYTHVAERTRRRLGRKGGVDSFAGRATSQDIPEESFLGHYILYLWYYCCTLSLLNATYIPSGDC